MRVIGISPLDKDSTVSFLEDGHVVFACGEERLSRVKLQSGFPDKALAMGFARTGWDVGSIDSVAYAFFDWDEEARLIHESVAADGDYSNAKALAESAKRYRALVENGYSVDRTTKIPGLDTEASEFMPRKAWWKRLAYEKLAGSAKLDARAHKHQFSKWVTNAVDDHRKWSGELTAGLKRFGLDRVPLKRFQHHDTHAANSFYASPFVASDALVVTLDGYGSGMCGGVYTADTAGIKNLVRFRFPNSLGIFYEHVTSGLGFKPSRHEGKIVGLASYGDPKHLADLLLEPVRHVRRQHPHQRRDESLPDAGPGRALREAGRGRGVPVRARRSHPPRRDVLAEEDGQKPRRHVRRRSCEREVEPAHPRIAGRRIDLRVPEHGRRRLRHRRGHARVRPRPHAKDGFRHGLLRAGILRGRDSRRPRRRGPEVRTPRRFRRTNRRPTREGHHRRPVQRADGVRAAVTGQSLRALPREATRK